MYEILQGDDRRIVRLAYPTDCLVVIEAPWVEAHYMTASQIVLEMAEYLLEGEMK
jgi:hypothetical protein